MPAWSTPGTIAITPLEVPSTFMEESWWWAPLLSHRLIDTMVGCALWVPRVTSEIASMGTKAVYPQHTSYLTPSSLSYLPTPSRCFLESSFPKFKHPESLPLLWLPRHSSMPAPHCLSWHKLRRLQEKKKKSQFLMKSFGLQPARQMASQIITDFLRKSLKRENSFGVEDKKFSDRRKWVALSV